MKESIVERFFKWYIGFLKKLWKVLKPVLIVFVCIWLLVFIGIVISVIVS